MKYAIVSLALIISACNPMNNDSIEKSPLTNNVSSSSSLSLQDLTISVTPQENRPVSFTNKDSAYFYTQTHINNHPEHSWFQGFNLAQKRLYSGYELSIEGKVLSAEHAHVTVSPQYLTRVYPNQVSETLSLFDDKNIIKVALEKVPGSTTIKLLGEQVSAYKQIGELEVYKSSEDTSQLIAIAPISPADKNRGFYILVAETDAELKALLNEVRENDVSWTEQRISRLTSLINDNAPVFTSDANFNSAIAWMTLNLDQLVTKQRGHGIYAGLPWFNEYWGRDQFIALPGASLVSGQFDWARNIITSFAEFQDTDPDSIYYGRIPNRLKMDDINYQTTDGTPRFVSQMMEYVKYSGDTSLIKQMYPAVKRSIEGSIKNWIDENGYLIHKDNETWMDARHHPSHRAYSPRDSRANDIQALWHEQLLAGVYFAEFMQDYDNQIKWQNLADKLKRSFNRDFVLPDLDWLVDRVDPQNVADTKLRPNQFFAFDLVNDEQKLISAAKQGWQQLVYPWGVASLTNQDPYFHPYHLAWQHYHKDQAYHNGTVWLWNNGIVMQRLIELGQQDTAYKLFANMNDFALKRGVVGGLAENSDAYPKQGETWPKLTGTYLQAWSNSEHLRVWYQDFLGFKPDLVNKTVRLKPRLPSEIDKLHTHSLVGQGKITLAFKRTKSATKFEYSISNYFGQLAFDAEIFDVVKVNVVSGDTVSFEINNTAQTMLVVHSNENTTTETKYNLSKDKFARLQSWNKALSGLQFAKPLPVSVHKVLESEYQRN